MTLQSDPSQNRINNSGQLDLPSNVASATDSMTAILTHSVSRFGLKFERFDIRRAVGEAVRTWPGSVQDRWWKWLTEAGASLDLRISVVECPVDEALHWVDERVQIALCKPEGPGSWLVVDDFHRGKYRILLPDQNSSIQRIRKRRLRRILEQYGNGSNLRAVTIEPALTCDPDHHERETQVGPTMKPLARTLLLLRADWSDIWVVLVFILFSGVLALAMPMAVQTMISLVAFGRFLQPVIVLSVMLLALMVFYALLRLWESYIVEILQRRLFARVVHDLGYRLTRLRQDSIDMAHGPELTNRFFDIVTLQKVTAQLLLDAADLIIVSVVGMVVLAVYHPLLLGFDIVLLMFISLIVFVLGRGGIRTSVVESKYKYSTAAWLQELTRCPVTFKLDNASEFAEERAEYLVSGYLESRHLHYRILFRQIAFSLGLYALSGSVLLGVGGWLVIQGQLTLGQLVAAEMIVAIIVGAFTKLGKHMEAYYDLMAGVDKLGVLFDLPLESQQGLMRLDEDGPARLSLRSTNFSYGARPVLENVSFEIKSGEHVAVVGDAGCGKSTLAEMLYGLRKPDQGQLLLDGHEISDVRPDVWRRHVMLMRRAEVFEGTVMENIHMVHPEIDPRLVRTACEQLGLLDSNGLPQGLETRLSSTGVPLSDSQLVRVVFARALVHQPRLLVIDGLLDGLSPDALEPVLDKLFDPNAPWTLVVISSNASILARCDRQIDLGKRQQASGARNA